MELVIVSLCLLERGGYAWLQSLPYMVTDRRKQDTGTSCPSLAKIIQVAMAMPFQEVARGALGLALALALIVPGAQI